jgi:hypothetical protein
MSEAPESPGDADGSRLVPLAARLLAAACLFLCISVVAERGAFPEDDALRHAAKAVADRDWSEILVLRPDVTVDSHPGWHALLGLVRDLTGARAPSLVLLSVFLVFCLVTLVPVFTLRRPEAWLLALVPLSVTSIGAIARWTIGRPFGVSIAFLLLLCLLWGRNPTRTSGARQLALLGVCFGLVVWIHPSWHLYGLPIAACCLARRWRLALGLTGLLACGVTVAALLSGAPVAFVVQGVRHTLLALGTGTPSELVAEFGPSGGSPGFVGFVLLLLLWRHSRGAWRRDVVDDPLFALAALGWVVGLATLRVWSDWGIPAALVWIALELQEWLEERLPEKDPARLLVTLAGAAAVSLSLTSSMGRPAELGSQVYAALLAPESEAALPEAGGILYSDELAVFYQLFYRAPTAPWRYMVGYEPALMPPEDLEVFREIRRRRSGESFAPWVRKMRPEDRMILRSVSGPPAVPGLEWMPVTQTVWSGRRTGAP